MDPVSLPDDQLMISNKHKQHWTPFDRQKPPHWLTLGPSGNDDKRKLITKDSL